MSTSSSGRALAVVCPACQQALRIKGFRAGRYSARCPHCHVPVRIHIAEQAAAAPQIEVAETPGDGPSVAFPGEAIPETLGGYRLVHKLGQGGMGAVYLARQLSLDRNVALKVLSQQWVDDPRFLIRFVREAHAAAKLAHHNIVQIYDIGNAGRIHFFSMEFVEGQTLGEMVRQRGRLDVRTALDYIIQAAHGLHFAHQHGLVHRDIKPDNLMVNGQGILKVADLGLVKTSETEVGLMGDAPGGDSITLTRLGTGMGTPAYIAPEQARDAALVDARADIYSLGCTLHVLLTGTPPFQGESATEVLSKHLTELPAFPTDIKPLIPSELWLIIARMLAKQPEDRFSDMGEVVAALERFRQLRPDARPPGLPTEEEVSTLSRLALAFHNDQLARATPWFIAGWLGICALLLFFCALRGWGTFAAAVLVAGPLALITRALVRAYCQRTALFTHLLHFAATQSWRFWVGGLGVSLLVSLVFYLLVLLVPLMAAVAVAAVLGGTFYFFVDSISFQQRREAIDKTLRLLQRLRLRSLNDWDLWRFVAAHAGPQWEEFYETLFGFEALCWAKGEQVADASGKPRDFRPGLRERFLLWLVRTKKAESPRAGGVDSAPVHSAPPGVHSP